MPGRTESPSAQLGQLLLRGWTMLAEACQDCQLPLMRDPSTMLGHCVGCRKMYDAEGHVVQDGVVQSEVPSARMNGPVSTAAGNNSSSSTLPASAAPTAAADGASAAAAAVSMQAARASQQQQQSGEPDLEEARRRYQQMRQQREAAAAAAAGGSSSDPCQVLSDHLLQGWTMLADHCPICSSPLMRSRALQVRCVVCDLPVQMPGSTAAAAPASAPAAPAAAATSDTPAPAAATIAAMEVPLMNGPVDPAAATAAAAAAAAEDDWARWAQQQARAMLSGTHSGLAVHASQQQVPAGGVLGTSAGTGNGRLLVQQQQVLSSLQDALLRKLDEARQLLLQTPAAQGEQMGQQLQLVQQLLQTLETTKQGMQQ